MQILLRLKKVNFILSLPLVAIVVNLIAIFRTTSVSSVDVMIQV